MRIFCDNPEYQEKQHERIRKRAKQSDKRNRQEKKTDNPCIICGTDKGVNKRAFHLKMDGNRLFKQAIGCMSEIAREALQQNGLTINDLGLVVPHQANIRIIQALATNLHIPMEKVYTNIHRYGNTSSATIPIALDEANREGRLIKDTHVLLVTFGAGLTWGASIIK